VNAQHEQLAAAIDRARDPAVERVRETIAENSFTGVVGEAESGKTYILGRAGRILAAEGWRHIRLDLDDVYSSNHLAWVWAREMARMVMDGVAFSHMTSLIPSMWPSTTRGEVATLAGRIGAEAASLSQMLEPDGTVGSTKQLVELAQATAQLAREYERVVLVVDHLEAQETTRARTPDARELLWIIRSAAQHVSELHVVAVCRPAARDLAADSEAAYQLDGRWLTVGPLTVADVPGDLSREEASAVIAATRGHPVATHELVVEMLTGEPSAATPDRPGVALQTAVGRLAARHGSLAGRYLQHARSLHRLGGHLLKVIARGEGPYAGSSNVDGSQVGDAMKRLDLAGLVAKPNRAAAAWVIADPRVAWVLTNQPAWIIPAPVRGVGGARATISGPEVSAVEDVIGAWPGVFDPDERLLLDRLMAGATNEEIADRLGISRATVTRQLTRVYEKLGVSGRQEAVQHLYGLVRTGGRAG
jgi:DNA-binding CsgD family transcriptional regulator/energy-coupling factor transporter ATP-binding protein EcfA2